jgi:hypothetical protein
LAANSVALDIGGSPDRPDYVLWVDPTWQLLHDGKLVAGSRQAQDESVDSGFQAVGSVLEELVGRVIEALDSNSKTGDLHLRISGGFELRTFAADPRDDLSWYVQDRVADQTLIMSPAGPRHERAA